MIKYPQGNQVYAFKVLDINSLKKWLSKHAVLIESTNVNLAVKYNITYSLNDILLELEHSDRDNWLFTIQYSVPSNSPKNILHQLKEYLLIK